jgi:hypothetical protein
MFRAYDRVFIASCIDFRVLCAVDYDMGQRRGEDALSYVTHVIVMWFALAHTMTPTTSWAYWRQGDTPIELYETILSGDLAGNDVDINDLRYFFNEPTRRENSFHMVIASGADETAVLDGLSITGGHAYWGESQDQESGGGMYTLFGNPSVVNCTFRDNYGAFGGGMYNEQSSATVTNCTFQTNGAGFGGGICNMRSEPRVNNCTFTGNYVYAVDGGGMYNGDSNALLTGCTFSKNTAWTSGGGMADSNSSTTVTDCIFSDNRALYFGGGLYCEEGSWVTVKDGIIEGNSTNWGGGIYSHRSSLTIKNTIIRDNRVSPGPTGFTGRGGGIFCSYSHVTIAESVIARNQAKRYAGGISSDASELVLMNTTMMANEAITRYYPGYGGAISCSGSVTLINTTMVGNRARGYAGPRGYAPGEGGGIRWGAGTELIMVNCLVRDNRPDQVETFDGPAAQIKYINIEGGWAGVGNIDTDPCFAEAGYWDPNGTPEDANDDFWVDGEYHLKSQAGRWDPNAGQWTIDNVTSPCIDAGDPMSPIGYEPFPNGGVINMGVYGGTAEASKSYFGGPPCETIVAGDINGDCKVDFEDFRLMGLHWLEAR